VKTLKRQGEADNYSLMRDSEYNRHVQVAESFFSRRIAPMLATHPNVEWRAWRYDSDKALSEAEFKDIASEFDIQANPTARHGMKQYYPQIIRCAYRRLRNVAESDTPIRAVADWELRRSGHGISQTEDWQENRRVLDRYLTEFPEITPPEEPVWVWVEDSEGET